MENLLALISQTPPMTFRSVGLIDRLYNAYGSFTASIARFQVGSLLNRVSGKLTNRKPINRRALSSWAAFQRFRNLDRQLRLRAGAGRQSHRPKSEQHHQAQALHRLGVRQSHG